MHQPLFSICIPQYRRPKHLIAALKSLCTQQYKNFEVCISDDGSPVVEYQEVLCFLKETRLNWRMIRGDGGDRYDVNLRNAIEMARGRYCFLLGNDDALAENDTLSFLVKEIHHYNYPEAIITNYQNWEDGRVLQRITKTKL